jgi:type IV pilus biogenesis protein PilP
VLKRSLITFALLGSVALPAVAQQSLPPLPSGGMPSAPIVVSPGPGQAPIGLVPLAEADAKVPGAPAPIVPQPDGGFNVQPPQAGAEDPAKRMNLRGATDYAERMQNDARERLQGLTVRDGAPNAQVAPGQGPLGTAPIASASDLEALTGIQRNISLLEAQVKEAELAVKLWGTLYNNASVKEWREEEKKAKEAAAKAAAPPQVPGLPGQLNPAMGGAPAQIINPEPVVVEVRGRTATLLIPGSGQVTVREGQTLPEGRIVKVSLSGVEIQRPTGRSVLGWGTSFPLTPQAAPPLVGNGFASPMGR